MAGAAVAGRAARRLGRSPLCVAPAPRAAPAWARGRRRRVLGGRPGRGGGAGAGPPAPQTAQPSRRCPRAGPGAAGARHPRRWGTTVIAVPSQNRLLTSRTFIHLGSHLLPVQEPSRPTAVCGDHGLGSPVPCAGRHGPSRLSPPAPGQQALAGAVLVLQVPVPTGCHRLGEEPRQSAAGKEQDSGR